MRYLLFLLSFALALGGCAGQPSPQASPTATEILQTPSPTPTFTPTSTSTPSPTPTQTPTQTPTPQPTATPTPEIQRVVYLEDSFSGTNRAVFEGPNPRFENDALFFTFPESGGSLLAARGFPFSNFRLETRLSGKGAYGFIFGDFGAEGINYLLVLEQNGQLNLKKFKGEEYLGLRFNKEVTSRAGVEGFHNFGLDYDGKRLMLFFDGEEVGRASESLPGSGKLGLFVWNEPEKDVWVGIDYLAIKLPQELIPTPTPPTPTPTETPRPPLCEIPHFVDRTPDRKTGYVIASGEYKQFIKSPEWPYQQWWWRIPPEDFFVSTRMARIDAIDRENQIITFYIGNGVTIQRKFTENTKVIMHAHEIYRGMPSDQAWQWGGNLCDLEVDDAVAILHPSEGESANPNSDLTDLWGVYTVQ